LKYYVRKLISFITTLFLVSLVTFFAFEFLPGNPALLILGPDAEDAQIEALEQELNLDKPALTRYVLWIKGACSGDLGKSYSYKMDVSKVISQGLKVTIPLSLLTLLFTIIIGTGLGIFFARHSKNPFINGLYYTNQIWVSIPAFCSALILIWIFTFKLHLLPSMYCGFKSLILPALSIAIGSGTILARYIKNNIENEFKQDYVRTALSKGLSKSQVIYKHILRNSLITAVTTLGITMAEILGGSIIIENIFTLPGIGQSLVKSIHSRDFTLIQGLVLYLAFITLACNLTIDVLYKIIDPRTKEIKEVS